MSVNIGHMYVHREVTFCFYYNFNYGIYFQVLKAARLLFKPPSPVDFVDEQEMRNVYSVIYDVFRCTYYQFIVSQLPRNCRFYRSRGRMARSYAVFQDFQGTLSTAQCRKNFESEIYILELDFNSSSAREIIGTIGRLLNQLNVINKGILEE